MAFQAKRILVIDDEYEIVELVKAILKSKGYQVLTAYDGVEGFEVLTGERPDLVVVDLRMPRMSGMEFCRKVRATPEVAATPLLVISCLTAGSGKSDDFWASGLGSDDFLPKPFDPLNLLGRVECLLRKHQYVSLNPSNGPVARGAGAVSPSANSAAASSAPAQVAPEEVVRMFVESWNQRNFSHEFDALSDEMLGGLSRAEYVQRRAQLYADEHGEKATHHVLDMAVNVTHNLATVACLREDMVRGIPHRKEERYTLRKTPNGWKIIAVKSRPIVFSLGE